MDKQDLKNIIQQEIKNYMTLKQFNISKIPAHEHNGVDTVQINEKDVLNSDMFAVHLVMDANETFYVKSLPFFKSITFYGIAANGGYGGVHTKKATITGEVQLGKTYDMTLSGNTFVPSPTVYPFLQVCNSIYVDTTDATKMFVNATGTGFAYAWNGTSDVALATITAVDNTSISIKSTLDLTDNWYIEGFLFFS
jgi:hypothetical protein